MAVSSPVKGPDGKRGTQVWGKPCHIIAFGKQTGEDPKKLARLLYMFETLMTDTELSEKIRIGEEGKHWEFNDKSKGFGGGFNFIAPYDDANVAGKECLSDSFGAPAFFMPFAEKYDDYLAHQRTEKIEINEKYANPEWGMSDAFGKPDVLPSASEYFEQLRTKQINLMVDIIKGKKSADDYDEFRKTWDSEGGKTLEEEAAVMEESMNKIYSELGIE